MSEEYWNKNNRWVPRFLRIGTANREDLFCFEQLKQPQSSPTKILDKKDITIPFQTGEELLCNAPELHYLEETLILSPESGFFQMLINIDHRITGEPNIESTDLILITCTVLNHNEIRDRNKTPPYVIFEASTGTYFISDETQAFRQYGKKVEKHPDKHVFSHLGLTNLALKDHPLEHTIRSIYTARWHTDPRITLLDYAKDNIASSSDLKSKLIRMTGPDESAIPFWSDPSQAESYLAQFLN